MMFKIEPIQDKSRQKELCEAFEIEYNEDFFGYYMYNLNTGVPMGMSQFEINGESGYIKDIVEYKGLNDGEAMFILGRQTMNFIDICGAHLCYAREDAAQNNLLSAIGFKEKTKDGLLFCDMTGMFSGNCKNH